MEAYLNSDAIKQMEEATTCFRDKLLVRLSFHLGCCVSEALILTVDDIGFTQRKSPLIVAVEGQG